MNTGQQYRAILKLTNNPNMNLLNIYVSNVNIINTTEPAEDSPTISKQKERVRFQTNNINIKLLNVHVTSVNIRQQHKDFLRFTNNLNMKVLNIPVPNVNIKVSNKG